jgi:hypothetical protein
MHPLIRGCGFSYVLSVVMCIIWWEGGKIGMSEFRESSATNHGVPDSRPDPIDPKLISLLNPEPTPDP